MPTLKTKCRLWFSMHSRMLSGLQFAVLVLVLSAASGLAAAALIRIMYVEQITDLKSQYSEELHRLDMMYRDRLDEKDRTIAQKDDFLKSLADKLGPVVNKVGRAADTANQAATSAALAVEQSMPDKPKPRIEERYIEP